MLAAWLAAGWLAAAWLAAACLLAAGWLGAAGRTRRSIKRSWGKQCTKALQATLAPDLSLFPFYLPDLLPFTFRIIGKKCLRFVLAGLLVNRESGVGGRRPGYGSGGNYELHMRRPPSMPSVGFEEAQLPGGADCICQLNNFSCFPLFPSGPPSFFPFRPFLNSSGARHL